MNQRVEFERVSLQIDEQPQVCITVANPFGGAITKTFSLYDFEEFIEKSLIRYVAIDAGLMK